MSNVATKTKSKRTGQPPSKKLFVTTWIGVLLSIGLLFEAGSAVLSDLTGFRSCNSNTSGLSVAVCGKQSVNFGDIMLMILFVAAAALVVSLATVAWRMTRKLVG
jgi:hypothetical protein